MSYKKLLPLFVVGAIAIAGLLGVAAYQPVAAQATTPTPSAPATQANPANPAAPLKDFGGKGGMRGGYNEQGLATALGIDLTKLQAAEKSAEADALKQAVAAGQITQAQADEITARGGHFGDFGHFGASGIDYNALLAKALGISSDQLQAGYVKAYNTAIDSAVTNGNLTQAQADLAKGRYALENNSKYQSSLQSAYQAAVKQAVTDGVITQAQADQLLKNAPTMGVGGPGFSGPGFGGPGFGGPGGRGGGPRGPRPDGTQPTTPTNPSSTPTTPSSGIYFLSAVN